jgi:flagella basal body P-ring formation protein FlgA
MLRTAAFFKICGVTLLRLLVVFTALAGLLAEEGAAAQDPVLQIEIPAAAEVSGATFLLGDIAQIRGDPRQAQRIRQLEFSSETGYLARDDIIDALQRSGVGGIKIELKMPSEVRLRQGMEGPRDFPAPYRGGGSDIDLSALVKQVANWQWDLEVDPRGSVPEGRLVGPDSIVPGTAAATLRFRDAQGREKTLAVRLAWFQPVVVLTRNMPRGSKIGAELLSTRIVKITRPGLYVSSPEQVVGKVLTRNLQQGEPLAFSNFENQPIIERGQVVTIYARKSGILVESQGTAMENGALEDVIRVRNNSTKVVVTARVRGEGIVEVEVR